MAWEGTIGEFSEPPRGIDLGTYTTSIDWGDGQSSPGTIVGLSFTTFAVIGSHTYSQPRSGSIAVTVKKGVEIGSWTAANVTVTPPPLEFVGTATLAAVQRGKGVTGYKLVFRLNRALPQSVTAKIEGSAAIGGGPGSSLASFGPHRGHACYASVDPRFAQRLSRARRHHRFTVTEQRPTEMRTAGNAVLRGYSSFRQMQHAVSRKLGC